MAGGSGAGYNYVFLRYTLAWHKGKCFQKPIIFLLFYLIAPTTYIKTFYQYHYTSGPICDPDHIICVGVYWV
jgi:hypothetical protein